MYDVAVLLHIARPNSLLARKQQRQSAITFDPRLHRSTKGEQEQRTRSKSALMTSKPSTFCAICDISSCTVPARMMMLRNQHSKARLVYNKRCNCSHLQSGFVSFRSSTATRIICCTTAANSARCCACRAKLSNLSCGVAIHSDVLRKRARSELSQSGRSARIVDPLCPATRFGRDCCTRIRRCRFCAR